jgi:hypothetical protein
MRSTLTMLLRLPQSLPLVAGLMVCSPFAWPQISLVQLTTCASPATTRTIPASGSGHLIVAGWSSTFEAGATTLPIPLGASFQDLYNTLRTQTASFHAVVSAA